MGHNGKKEDKLREERDKGVGSGDTKNSETGQVMERLAFQENEGSLLFMEHRDLGIEERRDLMPTMVAEIKTATHEEMTQRFERSDLDPNFNEHETENKVNSRCEDNLTKCSDRNEHRVIPVRRMINRPGITVAPASSSNIGDLSINDEFAEVTVEKFDTVEDDEGSSRRDEPLVILSMTATKSTSENLVSSSSEINQTMGILTFVPRCPAETEQPIDFTSPMSRHPRNTRVIQPHHGSNNLYGAGVGADSATSGEKPETNGNGNSIVCYLSEAQAINEDDLSGGCEGEDDDSSGIILKDETDSAEDEVDDDQDELTDSASETGGGEVAGAHSSKRLAKPVIIISDQNYPRLVINFGEEEKGFVENCYPRMRSGDPAQCCGGNDEKVGNNNNSIKNSTYIPIENWVESVQRHNKRKRTDSERLEELP